jgi:mono/diheme cytochrome c family protein
VYREYKQQTGDINIMGNTNKATLAVGLFLALGYVFAAACKPQPAPVKQEPPQPKHSFSVKGGVREMRIDAEMPEFPEGEGKADFVTYCGICHTLKYVNNQPDFPAKIWEAEVTKMVVKYHAPIDSVHAKKIVDYLVAIKGKN